MELVIPPDMTIEDCHKHAGIHYDVVTFTNYDDTDPDVAEYAKTLLRYVVK